MNGDTLLVSVLLALVAVPAWAQEAQEPYKPKPLPKNKDSLIWETLRIKELEFRRKHLVENYRKHGKTDPKWDAEMVAALADFREGLDTGERAKATWCKAMCTRFDKIRSAGCDDPMLNYGLGCLSYFAGDLKTAIVRLSKAEDQLRASSYPASFRYSVAHWLYVAYHFAGNKEAERASEARLTEDFIRSAADEDFKNGNQRHWVLGWARLRDMGTSMPPVNKDLVDQLERTEGVDPWILHLCKGLWGVSHAWEARGTAFADKVSDEAWEEFYKRIAVAERHLKAAHELHPEFPEAATGMLDIAKATHDSHLDVRMWFDRAVAAQFDYGPAYACLLSGYRPRWQGSLTLLLDFGRECLETKRFDTEVPDFLLNAVWLVGMELEDLPKILKHEGIYELLVEFLDACVSEPSRAGRKNYWLSFRVLLDHMTGRSQEAAARYRSLGKNFDKTVFKRFNLEESAVLAKFEELDKKGRKE